MNKTEIFKEFPAFNSENLIFRELQETDLPELKAIWSNHEVMKYTGEKKSWTEKIPLLLNRAHEDFKNKNCVWFVVTLKNSQQVIAVLIAYNLKVKISSLQFLLYHNQTECSQDSLIEIVESAGKYFNEKFEVNRIEFRVPPINHTLVSALEKSCFKGECFSIQSLYLHDFGLVDELVYGSLKSDKAAVCNYQQVRITDTLMQKSNTNSMDINLLFKESPVLEDETIILKPLCLEDVAAWHEMYAQTEIFAHTTGNPSKKIADTEKLVKGWLKVNAQKKMFVWSIFLKENRDFAIGHFIVHGISKELKEVKIGCMINKKYWHKQAATRSTRLVCDYLLNKAGVNRIVAEVVPENIGSCRVIEKCGFTLEGTLRQAVYYQQVEDVNVYALMRN